MKSAENPKPKLTLGTVKLGVPEYGFSDRRVTSSEDLREFLGWAHMRGIQYYDTSPRYGDSEAFLGDFVRSRTGSSFHISTKVDLLAPGKRDIRRQILQSIRTSLTRLSVEKIDIFYLHQNELEIISDPWIADAMAEVKSLGLAEAIGVSIYQPEELDYALTSDTYDFVQLPANALDTTLYEQFVRGYTGRVRFCARSLFMQGAILHPDQIHKIRQSEEIRNRVSHLQSLADRERISLTQLALRFVYSLEKVERFIVGTVSSQHLNEAIVALDHSLATPLFDEIYRNAISPSEWKNPRNW